MGAVFATFLGHQVFKYVLICKTSLKILFRTMISHKNYLFRSTKEIFLHKKYFDTTITVCPSKIDTMPRNMLLIKNPQFSPNFNYTLPKWSAHWIVILTKYHKNWVKIVDFLLVAYFWAWCQFRLDILYKCKNQKPDRKPDPGPTGKFY